jgi:hypothetical protein
MLLVSVKRQLTDAARERLAELAARRKEKP